MLPLFLRWHMCPPNIFIASVPALSSNCGSGQMQGYVHGSVREEFWAKTGKEPTSFPLIMARMGPKAMDQESSQQQSQEMAQCEALDQAVPEGEYLALVCSVIS